MFKTRPRSSLYTGERVGERGSCFPTTRGRSKNPSPSVPLSWVQGRGKLALALIGLLGLAAGCQDTKLEKQAHKGVNAFYAGDFRRAQDLIGPVARKPDENFVLNNCRLGSAALADHDFQDAEDAFLRAYEVINSVGVNDGGRSLGAAVVNEKIKVWKGEPFERAMANFYLGLIYYTQRDYGNARAAFENSLFKLRDYASKNDEKHEYREEESNFAVALIMLGKTWQKLDRPDLAQANFYHAKQLRPDLAGLCDPDRQAASNLLVVVELGQGPRKIRDFDGSFVGFAPTPSQVGPIPWPTVAVDGGGVDLRGVTVPTIDLLAMAQDRHWQDIDTIRAVKSIAGEGLMVAGAGATAYGANRRFNQDRHDNTADVAMIAGLAAIGTGALLKASSFADVRQWEMLPRTVFVLPMQVSPGTHDVTVQIPGDRYLTQTWRGVTIPTTGEATLYVRLLPTTSGDHTWSARPIDETRVQKNPNDNTQTPNQ